MLDVNLGSKKRGNKDLAELLSKRFQVPFIFTSSYSDGPTIEMAIFTISKKYEIQEKPEELDNLVINKDAIFIKDKYR